jgi:formate C-acetyltransferase
MEDAVDWEATGCLAFRLISCDPPFAAHLNQAKIFEIMLNNGFDPRTKKYLGLQTGDATKFTSIEQFYEAFFKQMNYFAGELRKNYVIRLGADMANSPVSGLSCVLIEDSMVKGLAPIEGGNKYPVSNTLWVADRGITDVTDCLSAIKYLIFDKKRITMAELLDAIKDNWEGKENIRQMCLAAPKYGNDDDYVDEIFKYISSKTKEILQSRPCPITGQKPFLFKGAATGHIIHGLVVGALPNGRKAGTPVNDAGTSAMPGMDVSGPTALINSATKMDYSDFMGIAHNMKFSKELLNSQKKLEKVGALLKTYFAQGGWHIQFNIHSAQELLEAKKHPEKWRSLIVRVGGYSAYFVDLSPSLQDEIIARTLHQV